MSKINDRDIAELNSFWAYQNTNKLKTFSVNDKNFKQVGGMKIIKIKILMVQQISKFTSY